MLDEMKRPSFNCTPARSTHELVLRVRAGGRLLNHALTGDSDRWVTDTTIDRRSDSYLMFVELDSRKGDGLEVALEWDQATGETRIILCDSRAESVVVFGVPRARAADAFRHPFRYVP
jgi:hypothetical protein